LIHLTKHFLLITYKGSIIYIELNGRITQNIDEVIKYKKEDGLVHEGIEQLVNVHPICRFNQKNRKIFFQVAEKKKIVKFERMRKA
jgi:hypothetical protein